jgi:hypothetical protein
MGSIHPPKIPERSGHNKGFNARSLIKSIFDAPSPEEAIRAVPPQSLFLAIRQSGLSASSDLIEIATLDQCRLIIDFDVWEKDRFQEERFWEWLALGDDEDGLKILQKILQCVDLKLLSLMISRHVDVFFSEDATSSPPSAGYFTPDNGATWLFLKLEDGTQHFLFGRLLAMIFETNAELFYQLLSVPNVATESMLEEDSFTERSKRLGSEGIPDIELAAEIHKPLPTSELKAALSQSPESIATRELHAVEPLIYDTLTPQPLSRILALPQMRDQLEAEISYLMNGAIVYFGADFGDIAQVLLTSEHVKGILNIGLESAAEQLGISPEEAYRQLGLKGMYRHGLSLVMSLRTKASRVLKQSTSLEATDPAAVVLESLTKKIPQVPRFFLEEDAFQDTPAAQRQSLEVTPSAIMDRQTLLKVHAFLDAISAQPDPH